MKEKLIKKNWLKVVDGCRGEIEEIVWIENKTFDEIVKIGEELVKESVDELLDGCEDDEDREEIKMYIDEFCELSSKEGRGVELSLNEEMGVGFYDEDIVSELKDVNLNELEDERYLEVCGVIDEVVGSCWE